MLLRALLLSFLAADWLGAAASARVLEFVSDHCAPCREMEPLVASLVAEGHDIQQVNLSAQPGLGQTYRVEQTPSFLAIDGAGKAFARITGKTNRENLERLCALKRDASSPAASHVTPTALADYHRAVVRVGRYDFGAAGSGPSGTGTLISNGVVLTASHIFAEGSGDCWIDWGDGQHDPAELLTTARDGDLAVLLVRQQTIIRPIAVGSKLPVRGDEVEFVGFGGGDFRHFRSSVLGYQGDQMAIDFRPIPGDSGGPILSNGRVVGVQWGGPKDEVHTGAYPSNATCATTIQSFLQRVRQRFANRFNPSPAATPVAPPLVDVPQQPAAQTPDISEAPPVTAPAAVSPAPPVSAPAVVAAPLLAEGQAAGSAVEKVKQAIDGQPEPVKQIEKSIAEDLLSKILGSASAAIPTVAGISLAGGSIGIPAYLAFLLARGAFRWVAKKIGAGKTSAAISGAQSILPFPLPTGGQASQPSSFPLPGGTIELDRAQSLAQQFQNTANRDGRNSVLDAVMGFAYDTEIESRLAGQSGALAVDLRELQAAVNQRLQTLMPTVLKKTA